MELSEEIRINAPRATVFAALNDVAILKQAIPGCESLEAVPPTEFTAVVVSKVGPLTARFTGGVSLIDIVAPESYTMIGEGKGGPAGFAKMRTDVVLEDEGNSTLMRYQVKADIGGKLAQLGGALITKTSKKLAGIFFRNFEALVSTNQNSGNESA
jgi:carbon monoxide dehydrogenase subunit G